MKRAFDVAIATLGAMTAAALVAVVMPAHGQADAPCGAGGSALDSNGQRVIRTAEEATRLKLKVDKHGYWKECQPCLPAVNEGFRQWANGSHTCTSAIASDSNPHSIARDRVLGHGETGFWRQIAGPMRGYLTESCNDGARRTVMSVCEPAKACDTRYSTTSDGGATVYTYDARHPDKHVPLGAYVYAEAADGKRMRLQCVAGDLVKAPEPAAAPTPGIKPRTVTCGPQSISAGDWRWVYIGPRVDIGAVVTVERRGFTASQAGGGVKAEAVCMPTGLLKLGAN